MSPHNYAGCQQASKSSRQRAQISCCVSYCPTLGAPCFALDFGKPVLGHASCLFGLPLVLTWGLWLSGFSDHGSGQAGGWGGQTGAIRTDSLRRITFSESQVIQADSLPGRSEGQPRCQGNRMWAVCEPYRNVVFSVVYKRM